MSWRVFQWEATVDDLLGGLDMKAQVRVIRDLRKLAAEGNRLRYPHTASFGEGLFELRTSHNGMIYRHLFCFYNDQIVVLVSFVKKTQKTPQLYIDLARGRKAVLTEQESRIGQLTVH